MSKCSSLPLVLPCREAWPLRGWGKSSLCTDDLPSFRKKSGEESSHLIFSSHLFSRFFPEGWETSVRRQGKEAGGGGGGDPNMKMTGMLVVFLRGLNCWFWVSGRKANIFTYSAIALIKTYQSLLNGIGKWSPNGQMKPKLRPDRYR